jgi:tetratricopeptide (TPR) repeat protein
MALSLENLLESMRSAGGLLEASGISFEEQRELRQIFSNPRASWHHVRGQAHFVKKRYAKAIESFDRAIRADPNLAVAHAARGLAFAKSGDPDRAFNDFERAIDLGPDEAHVHLYHADALKELGRTNEQIEAIQRAISVMRPTPDTIDLWGANLALGQALRSVGRADEAAVAFERFGALGKDDVHWSVGAVLRGQALVDARRYDEAIEVAEKVIAVFPKLAMPHVLRGISLGMLGNFDDSLVSFVRGIDLATEQKTIPVLNTAITYLIFIVHTQNISYSFFMDTSAASVLMAAAERFGLPKDVVKAIGSLAADAARENTERARVEARPKWETDRAPDDNPASFAARAYAAEMAAGTLHRGIIRRDDPELHRRLNSWLRSNAMPEGMDIPTLPEWNTRELAKRREPPPSGRRTVRTQRGRLYDAARYRSAKPQ